MRIVDMVGKKYGGLTVFDRAGSSKDGKARWLCLCECGNKSTINGTSLRRGLTKSCGCLQKERLGNSRRTHGRGESPEYKSWCNMKTRCYNKNDKAFSRYGGSGIVMCDSWVSSFENFFEDMGERPTGTSIDRIDNNKGYCKENCKWSTPSEQANNQRTNRNILFKGETKTLSQWSASIGIDRNTLKYRLKHWPFYRAMTGGEV